MRKKRKPQSGVCGHCGRAAPNGNQYIDGKLVKVRCSECCEQYFMDDFSPSIPEKPGNP